MDAKNAEAGVWYQHGEYGKVLCCGRRGPEYLSGFVVRADGTRVKFLPDDDVVTKSLIQSWDAEPETPPLRPISGESTAKNVKAAMSLGDKAVSAVQGTAEKNEFSGPRSLSFGDVNHYVHMEDASYDDLQNLCLSLASTLEGYAFPKVVEGAEQPPTDSTGEIPQLKSGSPPELTDVGLRVDQHGNVVFLPDLGVRSSLG